MNWSKVYGLSLRHLYLIKSSFPRILELINWPSIEISLVKLKTKSYNALYKIHSFM